MRIIFLDIDGVLNSELFERVPLYPSTTELLYVSMLDPKAIEFLNTLCKDTDAKVVISSTWRHGRTKEYLENLLNQRGFTGEVIDMTPSLRDGITVRGNEIQKWIKDNYELLGLHYYEFNSYVILDDDSDMLYQQRNNFIHVDGYVGLTPTNCYKAKQILER